MISLRLYHFGARYYDPQLGRWTQQDPVGGSLGDLDSANRYVYANDDPVNAVDPSGKSWWDCFWAGFDTFFLLFGILVSVYAIYAAVGIGGEIGFFVALVGIVYAYIQAVRAVYGEYQVCFGQP